MLGKEGENKSLLKDSGSKINQIKYSSKKPTFKKI